jgi:hypothetical protein
MLTARVRPVQFAKSRNSWSLQLQLDQQTRLLPGMSITLCVLRECCPAASPAPALPLCESVVSMVLSKQVALLRIMCSMRVRLAADCVLLCSSSCTRAAHNSSSRGSQSNEQAELANATQRHLNCRRRSKLLSLMTERC